MSDVGLVRKQQIKYGVGINLEQALTPNVGLFARAAINNGATETYAFEEIDYSVSGGASIVGPSWGRTEDLKGIAFVRNSLSVAHRDYLSAGGLGFFVRDGHLSYKPEQIFETYYNLNIRKGATTAFGFKRIVNPTYNADRGPVSVSSVHYPRSSDFYRLTL